MSLLVEYIASLATWIYAICGLSALYYLYRIRAIRQERQQALFALEKERAARTVTGILTSVIGLVVLMSVTYLVSNVMADAMDLAVESVEAEGLATGQTEPAASAPVAVSEPAPAAEPETAQALLEVPFCEDTASVISPGVGQEITGVITVAGTATDEFFESFHLEIAPGSEPDDGDYTPVGTGYIQVRSGQLMEVDTTPYISGLYTLRLRVMNTNGEFVGTCEVEVRIVS